MMNGQSIAELSRKLEEWRREDIRRANQIRYQNLSYILWGFALASTSFVASNQHLTIIIITIVFWVMGFAMLVYSAKFRKKK